MGYLPDPFIDAYPSKRIGGVEVSFAIEPEPLGTAGAIRYAANVAGIDETFLAVNGDVLTDLDVTGLVALHRARGAEATIALTPVEDPSRYGVVVTDDDGRVLEFVEKPPADVAPSNHINAGTYVIEPGFVDRVAPDVAVSVETEIFPRMVASGALYALLDDAYWLDAGTPRSYVQANTDLVDGARQLPCPGARVGTSLVDATTDVAASATLEHSVLGAGVVVEDGVELRRTVVLDGARIEARAVIVDSVVGPGAVIGAGATLTGHSLIARGAQVPAGTQLEGAAVTA
jgi:mannose-1-phosphate guanylyltransferase